MNEDIEAEVAEARSEALANLESQEEEKPVEEPEKEETTESESEEETKEESTQDDDDKSKSEEDKSKEESEEKQKPWQAKKVSAEKRINQLTAQAYKERQEKKQLRSRVEELERLIAGDPTKPKTREDFVDDKEYQEYRIDNGIREGLNKETARFKQEQIEAKEQEQLTSMFQKNLENARANIPDIGDKLQYFNNEIPMSPNVAKHLLGSPAGAYTMARIADDPDLTKALLDAPTQQVDATIAQIHDEIYKVIKQPNAVNQPIQPEQQQENKPSIPKPPTKKRGSVNTDLMSLDGDAFLEAYNKKFY